MSIERLSQELATYDRHKDELVAAHAGQFVLVHGDDIAGTWDTYKDALEAGYGQYGLQPFLVKQIRGTEQVQFFTRDLVVCPS
jgi:hypothetical protein